jgi:hypothetical protein
MVLPGSGSKPCPDGYTLRKGYTRKLGQNVLNKGFLVRRGKGQHYTAKPKKSEITVPAVCAKNKSNSGNRGLRKGFLIKYGYSYKLADSQRHKALLSAINAYGKPSVYNQLNTVAKLAQTRDPNIAAVFLMDRDWVKGQQNVQKK